MIFYKKQALENHFLLKQAEEVWEEDLISDETFSNIKRDHPDQLYSPNFFIRVGLFVLTNLAASFSMGFIAGIVLTSLNENNYHLIGYFLGIASILVLELMLRSKSYYRSGVDDGLSWMGVIFFGMALYPLYTNHPIWFFTILLIIMAIASVRYLNEVLAAGSVIVTSILIYFITVEFGTKAVDFLPFIFLILCSVIVLIVEKFRDNQALRHWNYWHQAVHASALILSYLSINYYMVREGSILLMHKNIKADEPITLEKFFWFLTFLIPLVFIAIGLRKKQPLKYRIGMLTLTASILTVRNYYHLITVEIVLCIVGSLMIVLGYLLIRYLRENRHGYSYQKLASKKEEDLASVEALVVGESMGAGNESQADNGFGGGSSGGGGASSTF